MHLIGVAAGCSGCSSTTWFRIVAAFGEYGSLGQGAITFVGLRIIGTITIVAIWALANLQRARCAGSH